MWPKWEDDHMEYGEAHLIPVEGGYQNSATGEFITEDGFVYDADGELIYDPYEDTESALYDRDEYDIID